jgi:predicted permease
MQTILQSIQDFWQGNTQLKALGTLYLSQAPEGLALPIYTMDVISFTPQYESPTEYVYNRMTVQINCWATTDSTIFTSLDLIDS